jgi:osmotically-inducible protein OsmY
MTKTLLASEVKQQVREALAASPIQSHRRIRVEQAGNTVHLHGQVESFYYKQLAQEAVRNICRGVELSNDLDVTDAPVASRIANY